MTGFSPEQIASLEAPLGRDHVKHRGQAGRQVSYIEGWHAIAEANRIFGFDRWHRETIEMRQLGEPREDNDRWRIAYMAKVKIEVFAGELAVIREGTGCGTGIDRDLGAAHESAIKEAETDAMKRALMTFGNPFGLALYDKEQANVEAPQKPAARGTQPNDHPKRQQALDAFWRLKTALANADTPKLIDEIMTVNGQDFLLIKQVHAPSYDQLLAFEKARKRELYAALEQGAAQAEMMREADALTILNG